MSNPVAVLEQLRDILDQSIAELKANTTKNNDPPLDINSTSPHPLYSRAEHQVILALKNMGAVGKALTAYSDPRLPMSSIIYSLHNISSLDLVSRLNICEILGDKELDIEDLASKCTPPVNADKLGRHLRHLVNLYIFREVRRNVFANNSVSIGLRGAGTRAMIEHTLEIDFPSISAIYKVHTDPQWKDSYKNTHAAFNIARNTDKTPFEYNAQFPEIAKRIGIAMDDSSRNSLHHMTQLYPWAELGDTTIIDVGGGVGSVSLGLLQTFPNLKSIVQDRPEAVRDGTTFFKENLPSALQEGRIKFVEHDFFTPQPIKGAPIYFMRYIIHDWPDTDAIRILARVREAMSSSSRLLVCDRIILPSYRSTERQGRGEGIAPEPLLANWADAASSGADLLMMLNFNANERTKEEFEGLFKEAGLVLEKLYYQNGAVGILQCARVD